MLPSTGQFKSINCPFYDTGSCNRPYCHFRHQKKEEKSSPILATYNPTPKSVLEKQKQFINKETDSALEYTSSSKKPKLEYIPLPTKLLKPNKCSADRMKSEATYVPSAIASDNTEVINLSNETQTVTKSNNDSTSNITKLQYDSTIEVTSEDGLHEHNKFSNLINLENENNLTKDDLNNTETKLEESEQKVGYKSSSSSKHSNHNRSSSHRRSSSSKHKDRDKEKLCSRGKSKTSSTSSHRHSIESTNHKSSRSKHSKSASSSSSNRKHRHSSSSKDDNKSKVKRCASSSLTYRNLENSKHESQTDKPTRIITKVKKSESGLINTKDVGVGFDTYNGLISPSSIFDTDESDEDEIMKQCKLIFEEFTPNVSTQITPQVSLKIPEINILDENNIKKKRVAHENNTLPSRVLSKPKSKPNHAEHAMHSIYLRQEEARRQAEEKSKKEAEERHKLDAELTVREEELKAKEAKLDAELKMRHANTRLGNSRIGPVNNVIALQVAKQRIELLKKKNEENRLINQSVIHGSKTIAQTSKNVGRIAHISKVTPVEETRDQITPPVLEASSTKISYNIRMQYYNLMIKHCLNIYSICDDAWTRAQTEELAVMKKCRTPVIYKNSALMVVNKLRKESIDAGNISTEKSKTISHDVILAGKQGQHVSWQVKKKTSSDTTGSILDNVSPYKAYDIVMECTMSEEQLIANGYPRPGSRPGNATMKTVYSTPKVQNQTERHCRRCSKLYRLDEYDEECVDKCNYHPKGTGFRRGFADNFHHCCQQPAGTPGCMYGNYHVTDYIDYDNLNGFVTTIEKDEDFLPSKNDIFALDCEMCYTTHGLELTRITVVDINETIVYDALVKPDAKIIDYNTVFSGITETMLENVTTSLRDVQAILLSKFHSQTILIGHSLDSDFKALKLIHSLIVDTSVLFPHKMGPPKKRSLKNLAIEYLRIIIQENESGHDSSEDAKACIGLVKYYLRNKIL